MIEYFTRFPTARPLALSQAGSINEADFALKFYKHDEAGLINDITIDATNYKVYYYPRGAEMCISIGGTDVVYLSSNTLGFTSSGATFNSAALTFSAGTCLN